MARKIGCTSCSLKPETNLALMLCLVFYLYVCLGGALFLLLEGQLEPTEKRLNASLLMEYNISYPTFVKVGTAYQEHLNLPTQRRSVASVDNLWNFFEATDFAFQIVTCQGTGQTTRVIQSDASKLAYIFFVIFGVPICFLTMRATGRRVNMVVYNSIRSVNVYIFNRRVTEHAHIKALTINLFILFIYMTAGVAIYTLTQNWRILDSTYYLINNFLTIGNIEQVLTVHYSSQSTRDKLYRSLLNLYMFVGYTLLSSFVWSVHLFARHMHFKAQNKQLARATSRILRERKPWADGSRSQTGSPSKSLTRERDTDRESVC